MLFMDKINSISVGTVTGSLQEQGVLKEDSFAVVMASMLCERAKEACKRDIPITTHKQVNNLTAWVWKYLRFSPSGTNQEEIIC